LLQRQWSLSVWHGRILPLDCPCIGREQADQWASAGAAFWSCIVPGIVGALVCSLLVVPLSSDASRWGTAITFGAVSAGTGIIAFFWIAMMLAAEGAGAPFLVILAPLGLGVLVFGLSLLVQTRTAR
jgi:hypothetical protein